MYDGPVPIVNRNCDNAKDFKFKFQMRFSANSIDFNSLRVHRHPTKKKYIHIYI